MKRPDGWDELYLEAYRKEHTSGALYGSPERAMFEAGADAYEKELRVMVEDQVYCIEVNGIMGHYLFIPEEVE